MLPDLYKEILVRTVNTTCQCRRKGTKASVGKNDGEGPADINMRTTKACCENCRTLVLASLCVLIKEVTELCSS